MSTFIYEVTAFIGRGLGILISTVSLQTLGIEHRTFQLGVEAYPLVLLDEIPPHFISFHFTWSTASDTVPLHNHNEKPTISYVGLWSSAIIVLLLLYDVEKHEEAVFGFNENKQSQSILWITFPHFCEVNSKLVYDIQIHIRLSLYVPLLFQ